MTPPQRPHEEAPRLHPVEPPPAEAAPSAPAGSRRRRAVRIAGGVLVAAAVAGGAHLFLTRGVESTDDAQVEADVVSVAPRVAGSVVRVPVVENQAVKKGDLLFEIDPADFQARVRACEADLATARAQAAAADAQILVARAAVARSEAEVRKSSADLGRSTRLRAGGVIAQAELDAVRAAAETGAAGASGAAAQLAAARAGAELAHARAQSAQAALELARLQLSYTRVVAPRDGELSKLALREGQQVAVGQPVAQLVPGQTYLMANFKETQLGRMRPGQRVVVEIDAFDGAELEGRVESFSGGTGSRFSLLPPDNASGNFVKVVQRVPVRVAWTKVPEGVRLRPGLSAVARVHTR